jgi:hypothetical protein
MKDGIDTGLALRMVWPAMILSLVAVGPAGPLRLLFSCVFASLRLCVKILGAYRGRNVGTAPLFWLCFFKAGPRQVSVLTLASAGDFLDRMALAKWPLSNEACLSLTVYVKSSFRAIWGEGGMRASREGFHPPCR